MLSQHYPSTILKCSLVRTKSESLKNQCILGLAIIAFLNSADTTLTALLVKAGYATEVSPVPLLLLNTNLTLFYAVKIVIVTLACGWGIYRITTTKTPISIVRTPPPWHLPRRKISDDCGSQSLSFPSQHVFHSSLLCFKTKSDSLKTEHGQMMEIVLH